MLFRYQATRGGLSKTIRERGSSPQQGAPRHRAAGVPPPIDQSLLREDVERLRVPTRCLVLPQRIEQQRVAKIFEQKETRIRVCAHQPRHDDTIRLKELTYEQKRLILSEGARAPR